MTDGFKTGGIHRNKDPDDLEENEEAGQNSIRLYGLRTSHTPSHSVNADVPG